MHPDPLTRDKKGTQGTGNSESAVGSTPSTWRCSFRPGFCSSRPRCFDLGDLADPSNERGLFLFLQGSVPYPFWLVLRETKRNPASFFLWGGLLQKDSPMSTLDEFLQHHVLRIDVRIPRKTWILRGISVGATPFLGLLVDLHGSMKSRIPTYHE